MNTNEVAEIKDFPTEIVTAIESGINDYLGRSFLYSPFKLAFGLFKKANPKMMNRVRELVRNDVEQILLQIPRYSPELFVRHNELTPDGEQGYKISFNLGVHLMKNKLNLSLAFKVLRDIETRGQVYDYVLRMTRKSIDRIINGEKIES